MKKLILLCILLFTLGIYSSASAFPLWPGGTQFEDDNLDYLVDNDNDGLISSGDELHALIEFPFVVDPTIPKNPTYTNDQSQDELVAISKVKVVDLTDGVYTIGEVDDGSPMLAFYSGLGTSNLDIGTDPTLAAGTSAVTDGNFLWSFSLDASDPDTYWTFSPQVAGANDPNTVRNTPSSTKIGLINFQLNQVGGQDIFDPIIGTAGTGGDGKVDLIGSADILGSSFDGNPQLTNAFGFSDGDVTVNPIPEPTTLLLFGTGLLGLAAFGRKKFMNKS